MKDLIAKIKTLDYKQVGLNHGEKIGMGVVVLIVLTCLALTNWASEYTGEPRDLEEQAAKVDRDLKNKGWPEDMRKEFLPYLSGEGEVEKVTSEIDGANFDWGVPMSPKLYERQRPADEAKWLAVADLRAHWGAMPMGVEPPPVEEPAEETKPKKSDRKKKDRDSEMPGGGGPPLSLSPGGGPADMMMMMGDLAGGEKARGVRFVCLVGVVDVRQQQNLLRSALHVDTISQAAARLEYTDFKIQRQRAVPGPNPWAGEWKDWPIENSVEELGRAAAFDMEIVAAKYTNGIFTSQLPHRLDDEWDASIAGHPLIPTLSDDEQEAELLANAAAARTVSEAGDVDEDGVRRGGFSRVQKDANRLREQAAGVGGGAMYGDYMAEMMQSMKKQSAGMEGDMRRRTMGGMHGAMPGGMHGAMPGGMHGAMPGGMPMNAMYGGAMGMGMGGDLGAERLLFRYFDFDVEPGECYRYRVKLVVLNPSFQESFVSAAAVAEGQYRESDWSAPSSPVVVQNDVDYALARVNHTQGKYEAELKVVQFDTDMGTLIMDTLKVGSGAYVGTEKKVNTLHLDLGAPSLKEEGVIFSSRDVLVDFAGGIPSRLASSAAQDLKIADNQRTNFSKSGTLDMAVTLNRFGELVPLDAGSRGALSAAEKRVQEEREPYKDIIERVSDRKKKEKEDKASKSEYDIFNLGQDTDGKKKGKRGRVDNSLKRGMGMPPMSMMPGMGMPPNSGGRRGGVRND